jgi:hypothetical protein
MEIEILYDRLLLYFIWSNLFRKYIYKLFYDTTAVGVFSRFHAKIWALLVNTANSAGFRKISSSYMHESHRKSKRVKAMSSEVLLFAVGGWLQREGESGNMRE